MHIMALFKQNTQES